jgi:hypothetical protein
MPLQEKGVGPQAIFTLVICGTSAASKQTGLQGVHRDCANNVGSKARPHGLD